jgi:hypothetical protein
MAVYGPVRHQKNIIWTEAWVIWQYMDSELCINKQLKMFLESMKRLNKAFQIGVIEMCEEG